MKKRALASIHAGVLIAVSGLAGCGGGGTEDRRTVLSSACSNGNLSACSQLAAMPVADTTTNTTTVGTGTTAGGSTTTNTTTLAAISISPKELTIGDCTTNIPFIFSGGTPPFTILTSDNFRIPVSNAQALGSDYYFLASVGPLIGRTPVSELEGVITYKFTTDYPPATLTVLDSQQRTATTTLKFPVIHLSCPDNPLLQVSPASVNAHVTEILAFQVAGGTGTFSAVSSNDSIATVVGKSEGAITVQAKAPGTVLITVSSGDETTPGDGQKANIRFTVLQKEAYTPES